jgi:hypothetical protein
VVCFAPASGLFTPVILFIIFSCCNSHFFIHK